MRILVIEDNEDLRSFMRIALESAGYEVATAADGRQGVELQRSHPAAVVITDIFMPFMDGIETIAELRQQFPETRIIAISGGGDYLRKPEYLWAAREIGAVVTLQKPFGADALLAAVETLVAEGKQAGKDRTDPP